MNHRTLTIHDVMNRIGRDFIGFDNLFSALQEPTNATNYPPFNVERLSDDAYRLTLAVAGFSREEIKIALENGLLTIEGKKTPTEEKTHYLYRGIAEREFSRQFRLGEYIVVESADLANGLLTVDFKRELPEALKPREIPIGSPASKKVDSKKA